jgi:hypothetical protein
MLRARVFCTNFVRADLILDLSTLPHGRPSDDTDSLGSSIGWRPHQQGADPVSGKFWGVIGMNQVYVNWSAVTTALVPPGVVTAPPAVTKAARFLVGD